MRCAAVHRIAKWTPSAIVFDVPLRELAPDASGTRRLADLEHARAEARRQWLAELGDVARSEREVLELVTTDPGRASRDIVAGGQGLGIAPR
jgi:hypothetical protein